MSYNQELIKDHVLPNFLVIGAMKSGTTWLYEILKSNPEVYLYEFIKEFHFFTAHYEKGINWYKGFFPAIEDANKFKAIGDVTATYLVHDYVPARVLKHLPNAKFIIILRNPVNRAFSHYTYNKLNDGIKYNFEDYLEINSRVFRYGLYYQQIKTWFKVFPRERFLILIFEEIMKHPIEGIKKISKFLNIDYKKINTRFLKKKENPSYIPRLHKIFLILFKIRHILLSRGFYKLDYFLLRFRKIYSFLLLGKKKRSEKIDPIMKKQLFLRYKKEIEDLEVLLDINLDVWKF